MGGRALQDPDQRAGESRVSTPGTSAMRCSIAACAVNVGDPVPLDQVDDPGSASNSPAGWSRRRRAGVAMLNPLVWYIGPGMRIICAGAERSPRPSTWVSCGTDRPLRRPVARSPWVFRSTRSCRCRSGWGDLGERSVDSARLARTGQVVAAQVTLAPITASSTRSHSQSGRSQRTGTGTAPSFQAATRRRSVRASCPAGGRPGRPRRGPGPAPGRPGSSAGRAPAG